MNKKYEVIEVQSKALKAVIWDHAKNHMLVKFVNSPLYIYPDVTRSVFEALVNAPSKGLFFANVIKKQFPSFVRLDN